MNRPLVSVVVPAFNGEAFIEQTLVSLLSQTYPHLEIVVSDDVSSDGTHAILEKFKDNPRVVVLLNNQNLGLNRNLQSAIKMTHGDFICICGQDDLYPSYKINEQVRYLNETGKDVVYGSNAVIHKDEDVKTATLNIKDGEIFAGALVGDRQDLVRYVSEIKPASWMPMSQSALFRADVLREINAIRSHVFLDDWPILVECCRHRDVGFINKIMFYWRHHENNMHRNVWKNIGISVQALSVVVDDAYKPVCLSNNMFYGAQLFLSQKKFGLAWRMALASLVFGFGRKKLQICIKALRKDLKKKITGR
jgi:glycosyltransferase involved in cell wall biosynthesis